MQMPISMLKRHAFLLMAPIMNHDPCQDISVLKRKPLNFKLSHYHWHHTLCMITSGVWVDRADNPGDGSGDYRLHLDVGRTAGL